MWTILRAVAVAALTLTLASLGLFIVVRALDATGSLETIEEWWLISAAVPIGLACFFLSSRALLSRALPIHRGSTILMAASIVVGVLAAVVNGTYEDWTKAAVVGILATATVLLLVAALGSDFATSERRWRTTGSWAVALLGFGSILRAVAVAALTLTLASLGLFIVVRALDATGSLETIEGWWLIATAVPIGLACFFLSSRAILPRAFPIHLGSTILTAASIVVGVLAAVVNGTYEDWTENAVVLLLATAVVLLIAGFVTDVATSERKWQTGGSWAAAVSIVVLVFGFASYFMLGLNGMAPSAPPLTLPLPSAPLEPLENSSSAPPEQLLPRYPWPPEAPSSRMMLDQEWFLKDERVTSLYDVWVVLRRALRDADYYEFGMYAAPGGFAMLTRLEAIDGTGRRLPGDERYRPPSETATFSLSEYIPALFFAPEGYYRFVAFVVTDVPFAPSPEELEEAEALERLMLGAVRLPWYFDELPFTDAHDVHALIYEFRKRGRDVEILRPGRIAPTIHLKHAGVLAALTGAP